MTVLSLALREGTAEAHSLAEHTAFMKCFVRGLITPSLFRQFLANLYFVYTDLEAALASATSDRLRAMYFPELNRSGQLAEDLAFYYGDNWRDQITPSQPLAFTSVVFMTSPKLILCCSLPIPTPAIWGISLGDKL